MSNAVLSDLSATEVQPVRCRENHKPREIPQRDGSLLVVCSHCGAYLAWQEYKAIKPVKQGWQVRGREALEVA